MVLQLNMLEQELGSSFLHWRKHQAGKGLPGVSYIAWKLKDGVFPVRHLGGQALKEEDHTIKGALVQGMAFHSF